MGAQSTQSVQSALCEVGRALRSHQIITDRDVLQAYAHDESEVPPSLPDAVVRVSSTADVSAVLKAAHEHGVPVTPRAGGTGRTGGAVPVCGGIVMTVEAMNAVKGIERDDMLAVVEPGVVTGELHRLVESEGLFYPPDPNSLKACMIGGNVAENAGGPRAFKYGVTRQYVLGMQVVTPQGDILQVGKRTVKGVTGYDLTSLVVGSEGTLAVVTEVLARLVPLPAEVRTLVAMLPSDESVSLAVSRLVGRRIVPRCIELLDDSALRVVRPHLSFSIPEAARALLLVELDGDAHTLDIELPRAGDALTEAGALEILVAQHSGERERLWSVRRELSYAMRRSAAFKLAEDVVVPRTKLHELLALSRRLAEVHGIRTATYGHAGDGNLHVNLLWDDPAQQPHVARAVSDLFRAVVQLGGTLTGEHGVGVLKAPYLHYEQSGELIDVQKRIKQVFDPRGILNPGKIFTGPSHRDC
jgi:glycolate oxidase